MVPGEPHRFAGLDGVRGLAALAVVLCHGLAFFAGFSLGVDVFFVLSGFLITTILLRELGRSGRVSLSGFYAKRVWRLLPPVLPLVLVALVWNVASGSNSHSALATLFYFQNWRLAGLTQFPPDALNHTWSLSIEEQFYALWPLLLLFAFRRWSLRGVIAVCIIGIVASNIARAALTVGGAGQLRIAYGTDTRVDELLVGALMATLLARGQLPRVGKLLALAALGVLLTLAFRPTIDVIARPLVALSAATVIVYTVQSAPSWLSSKPLRFLGRISYALYLWHVVFFVIARNAFHLEMGPLMLGLVLLGGMTCAVISELVIEGPIRRARQAEPPGKARDALRPRYQMGQAAA